MPGTDLSLQKKFVTLAQKQALSELYRAYIGDVPFNGRSSAVVSTGKSDRGRCDIATAINFLNVVTGFTDAVLDHLPSLPLAMSIMESAESIKLTK